MIHFLLCLGQISAIWLLPACMFGAGIGIFVALLLVGAGSRTADERDIATHKRISAINQPFTEKEIGN